MGDSRKYRKIIPGNENEPWRFSTFREKYFEKGNLGFQVHQVFGAKLDVYLNDRRGPRDFSCHGAQGFELVALGYNTPAHYPLAPEHDHLRDFHNHLVLQAAAYQNGTWIFGVAKAGGKKAGPIGGNCIIAPTGEIVLSVKLSDELILAECDLDRCKEIQENIFNFYLHRQPEEYSLITALSKESASNGIFSSKNYETEKKSIREKNQHKCNVNNLKHF
ncbi:MAG: hypothetical protein Ct9H300mP21_03630 [Pseudomonadota bacterium]|nr:MAG: hypothetical protein Ct9H300mP21_03630 [Pseudomonadota bacterium]